MTRIGATWRRYVLRALVVAGGASFFLLVVVMSMPPIYGGDPPKVFVALAATRNLATYWEVEVTSGRQPTSLADLVARWPHLAESFGSPPVDPWGKPYLIVARQRGEVLHKEVVSCGPDGALDTEDDLRSPVSPAR